ncbi:MAG: hypothetical protein RL701_3396 [Pseudomonadota bacterium]|jgi:hypothetical protein
MSVRFWLASLLVGLAACGGDDGDDTTECVEPLAAGCAPSIPVDYDTIYTRILQPKCGSAGFGTNCHGSPIDPKGGLRLYDPDIAYGDLIGRNGKARVLPGNAECSLLVERLESKDPLKRMPLSGSELDPGLRCAVRMWVDSGAAR